MLIILVIAAVFFLLSLYFIFVRPGEEMQLAGTPEKAPVIRTPSSDNNLNRQILKELSETANQLEEVQTDLGKTREERDKDVSSLQTRIDELNKLLSEKDEELGQKDISINELKEKIDDTIGEAKNNEGKITEELNAANKSIAKLAAEAQDLRNEIAAYKNNLNEKDKETSGLKETIQKKAELITKYGTKKRMSYQRTINIIGGLRKKLREKEKEALRLKALEGDYQKLQTELSGVSLEKDEDTEKKDGLITELKNKLDAAEKDHIGKLDEAKREINELYKEVKSKDTILEELKLASMDKKRGIPTEKGVGPKGEQLKKEYEKLKSEYNDLKDKSNWLVKLVREESEKSKKMEKELIKTREILVTEKKTMEGMTPPSAESDEKRREFFLKIYEDSLKKIFVDERNVPTDYDSIKSLYLGLKKHSQLLARQLREAIDKSYELKDEVGRLRKED